MIGALIAFAMVALETESADAACFKYDPSVAVLTGVLTIESFGIPSRDGANSDADDKESSAILTLDKPICVDPSPGQSPESEPERNIGKVQMVFVSYPFGSQWHGKRVVVTGKLFHAITAHHHAKVLMMVKDARAAESKAR